MIYKIIGIIVIVAALAGGGFYYYQNMKGAESTKEESPAISETPTATPTPEEVDKAEFTIKILNGSGIAGEAGRAKTLLEDGEFTIDSTGNADAYDYEETVIQAGADVSDAWIEALTEELEKEYTVKATIEELSDDEDVDVVVIIGSLDEDGEKLAGADDAEASTDDEDASDEADTTTPTKSPTPTKSN